MTVTHAQTSSPTASQEQRVMLIAALLAFGMVGTVMAIRLGSWFAAPVEVPPEPETLPAVDRPLLTPLQREEARRSGVGAFEYDSIWYVDHTLPAEYWEDWRS